MTLDEFKSLKVGDMITTPLSAFNYLGRSATRKFILHNARFGQYALTKKDLLASDVSLTPRNKDSIILT